MLAHPKGGGQRRRLSLRSSERNGGTGSGRGNSSHKKSEDRSVKLFREHSGGGVTPGSSKKYLSKRSSESHLIDYYQSSNPESMTARADLLEERDWGFNSYP